MTWGIEKMENCYNEFIEHTYRKGNIICAEIVHRAEYEDNRKVYSLRLGYTPDEYEEFLKSLNFNYDSGYGGQELFGAIWYEDGTWSERGEYDGAEWWEHKKRPEIPENLRHG